MRGDEAQQAEGEGPRTRSGPRHAAPRKALLNRIQVPAGKVIAIAAMPTAVLMGMGFTPKLAQADEMPKNGFAPGPCVTQQDTPAPSDSATPKTTPSATPSATPSPSATADVPKAAQTPAPHASSAQPTSAPSGLPSTGPKSAPVTGPVTSPVNNAVTGATPAPSPDPKSVNPLDPLGIGDALKNLFGGGSSSQQSPSPAPTPSTTQAPAPTTTTAPKPTTPTAPTTAPKPGATSDNPVSAAKNLVGGTEQKARDAASAGTGAQPTPSATASGSPDGKQPFPCPTYDAKALADASLERTPSLLPDTPWILKTSMLTLTGLDYKGIVKVKTYNGTVKDVLKFTASGVDIKDLHQITDGPNGTKTHVEARAGSTSTIRDGTVTMYTESLKGNLFGLIPITFSPTSPPPLNVPFAFFTDATVVQAGQFGGTLTVPGMQVIPGQAE